MTVSAQRSPWSTSAENEDVFLQDGHHTFSLRPDEAPHRVPWRGLCNSTCVTTSAVCVTGLWASNSDCLVHYSSSLDYWLTILLWGIALGLCTSAYSRAGRVACWNSFSWFPCGSHRRWQKKERGCSGRSQNKGDLNQGRYCLVSPSWEWCH